MFAHVGSLPCGPFIEGSLDALDVVMVVVICEHTEFGENGIARLANEIGRPSRRRRATLLLGLGLGLGRSPLHAMPFFSMILQSIGALEPLSAFFRLALVRLLFGIRGSWVRRLNTPDVCVRTLNVVCQTTGLLVEHATQWHLAPKQLFVVVILKGVSMPLVVVVDDARQLLVLLVAASDRTCAVNLLYTLLLLA